MLGGDEKESGEKHEQMKTPLTWHYGKINKDTKMETK